jgi:hypothetical protein
MTRTRSDAATREGGRPKIRTALLSQETAEALLAAFGTGWNAYRQLRLSETVVSYPSFNRALRGLEISPDHLAVIVASWDSRRRQPVAA